MPTVAAGYAFSHRLFAIVGQGRRRNGHHASEYEDASQTCHCTSLSVPGHFYNFYCNTQSRPDWCGSKSPTRGILQQVSEQQHAR